MTADMPFPIGEDGRFEYDYLDRFWQHPYLIRSGDDLAGFALVIDECPVTGLRPCFFMAEFFVLKAYRRRGVGRYAADAILSEHRGLWHIGVIEKNEAAAKFWSSQRYGSTASRSHTHFDGEDWLVYEFTI
jgi:predicted acetyltransferase